MTVNEGKTKTMWFTSAQARKKLPDLVLIINGCNLEEVKHYSYLGFVLARYISSTTSKVSNKIFKLAKLRPSLTEKEPEYEKKQ